MKTLTLLFFLPIFAFCAEYKVAHDEATGKPVSVVRVSDGLHIPIDERNRDYALFLEWNKRQAVKVDVNTTIAPKPVASSEPPLTNEELKVLREMMKAIKP